ncbi:MAG: chromosomal replication initiator protein DnaA [Verrucomicrobia bacterium]|nr:MAG: chromosomal replication initiator protein DnaA [Verrucomicrobiota bacterium]
MDPSVVELWKRARQALRELLSPELFNLWFARLRPCDGSDSHLVLQVSNEFQELWLTNNYLSLLKEVVAHVAGQPYEVSFRVGGGNGDPAAAMAAAPGSSAGGRSAKAAASRTAVRKSQPASPLEGLNPRNTFETFVVGPNSQFAHAAAISVSQNPGKTWNPLFIYGASGLGKTHLLHAIGHAIHADRPNARIIYRPTEKFTNEFIEGIQNNNLNRFRRFYRAADVLLIDDIQFLQSKDRIQEEFFHTFNELHGAHRQIVLTSDRPVGSLEGLEHRLVSRFEWGLIVDLQPPDVETRMAIVRKKQENYGLHLPDEVVEFLAKKFRSNVRRLEGALAKLSATVTLRQLRSRDLTIPMAEKVLTDLIQEESRNTITVDKIKRTVADHYDLRESDLTSRRRPEHIAFPRQVAMYLCRELTPLSLTAIGEAFGGRDHGTVIHACRQVKNRMEHDPNVRQAIELIIRLLHT